MKGDKRNIKEERISLWPLSLDEAVEGFLAISPDDIADMRNVQVVNEAVKELRKHGKPIQRIGPQKYRWIGD